MEGRTGPLNETEFKDFMNKIFKEGSVNAFGKIQNIYKDGRLMV